MCEFNVLESDLWQSLEEAKKILLFTYNKLNNMTTEQYSKGNDKEIRDMIAKFLDIKE
jgi:hypothetical protein